MFGMKYYPLTMLFVFLGSMDCFTTVIGTKYFGTQELNPLIANLVHTNLPLFVVVKIAVSLLVALIFLLAEKILIQNVYGHTKAFSSAHKMLRFTYLGINLFLAMVVINNILVLINALL